ncbi:MAG: hypothetical protein U1E03_15330 [Hyphomonadaceae bacterium]
MAAPALTHAELAIKLVVEGCLPMVEGKQPAPMPIAAAPLGAAEKARLHVPETAMLVFYPIGETGVFMQAQGADAMVWYAGENCDGVLDAFETKLKRHYPEATLTSQDEYRPPGMRKRLYHIELGGKRVVDLEAIYPVSTQIPQEFVVRVYAQERP